MESLLDWISHYGYAGLFALLVLGVVGLPVPDEMLLLFSGYLISQAKLHPVGAWIAGVAGSMCGISISYTIGRTLGIGFVHRYGRYVHITEARIERVHEWFDRIGHWVLTVGYFIPGVRHFAAILAGTSTMPFREFAAFAYPGAILWVSSFLTLGYVFGENWRSIFEILHRSMTVVAVAAVILGLLIWWLRARRNSASRLQ